MAVDIPNLTIVTKSALVDSSGNIIGLSTAPVRIDPTGTTTQPTQDAADGSTGSATPSKAILIGASDGTNLQALRTPTIFKTAKATTTGTTAVWTPAVGKKFRLMQFKLQITADSIQTTGGVVDFDLQDSTTSLNLIHSVYIPGSALNTIQDFDSGWIDLGNGVRSSATNNVLNLVFTAAGFSGAVRVIACGTEE